MLGHFAWSFWAPAERACQARIAEVFAPGEHALVYALYGDLVAAR